MRCEDCGSLQTEPPFWLEDAYRDVGTGDDTGACQRNFDLVLQSATLLRLMRWEPTATCLDYGAGMGLFGRMMRDRGYNFFAYDKYLSPFYMDRYVAVDPRGLKPQLVTAFELLEHLPDPAKDLDEVFGLGADLVIATTEICDGQGAEWWYFNPAQGQHVFFYSRKAMTFIAQKYGYRYDAVL
ncbi:MAG: class I SAM-dependent methyltransferase, partial [Vulcanimicrobiaceae bacterium]